MYTSAYSDNRLFNPQAFTHKLRENGNPREIFKETLHEAEEVLRKRFKDSATAYESVYHRAWLIDQILLEAWRFHGMESSPDLALAAVGGYGRKELLPGSDVDILILCAPDLSEQRYAQVRDFVTFLWDIKLDAGPSVRTPEECREQAAKDITVMTALVEARLLIGPPALFKAMQEAIAPARIWPSREFFLAKWEEQKKRYAKYDDTGYNLEPNIKESPGGLRDIHVIGWVAKRHFQAETLHELVPHGFLTEEEYKTLSEAQEFLWSIRCLLHRAAGRRQDRLGFDYQQTLAKALGYEDTKQRLGVEEFMKKYYRTAKEVTCLNEMLLHLFQEAMEEPDKAEIKPLNKRFQARNNLIETVGPKTFAFYPFALLEIFLLLQQNNWIKGIRAGTVRLILQHRHLIDSAFHKDLRARSLFFEIVRQPQGQTRAFRMMNRYGVLPAYLPAFDQIVGQMQYDLFHVYTVDQHTLFVIRNLRRFLLEKHKDEVPICYEVGQKIPKPELLYLSGLFHDIAKGRGGDHSVLGKKDAIDFCNAHGLSDKDSRFVGWLVEYHLLLSTTAQREDISDPQTVHRFAQRMGDVLHLDYLFLLTVADIRGTNPNLWNNWKASLLTELYRRTRRALEDGLPRPPNRHLRISDIKNDALNLLPENQRENALKLWEDIDDNYFLRSSPPDIAREMEAIFNTPPGKPLALIRKEAQGGTEFLLYTPDNERVFADTTLYLEHQDVTIVDAYFVTTSTGSILVSYTVLESNGESIASHERTEKIRCGLQEALEWENAGKLSPVNKWQPRQLKYFPIPTRVTFNNEIGVNYTKMEIVTTDRPGVLSHIAQAFVNCNMRVKNAKIATFGSRVEDVFYITDWDNKPLLSPDQQDFLRQQLHILLDQPNEIKT